MRWKDIMEFFNNKRLLIILSGVACIMMALVIFTISTIGLSNLSSFIFGSSNTYSVDNTSAPVKTTPTFGQTTPAVQSPTYDIPTTVSYTTDNTTTFIPQTETSSVITTMPPTSEPVDTPPMSPTPIYIPVDSIKVPDPNNKSKDLITLTLELGKGIQLDLDIKPTAATNKSVTWKSNNENIVIVTNSGNVQGIAVGTTTITVTSVENPSKVYGITVNVISPIKSIKLKDGGALLCDDTSAQGSKILTGGDIFDLTIEINPADATERTLILQSSKSNIVIVPGSVTVPAGTNSVTIPITVVNNTSGDMNSVVTVYVEGKSSGLKAKLDITVKPATPETDNGGTP